MASSELRNVYSGTGKGGTGNIHIQIFKMASNDPDGLVRNKFSGNLQQVTQGRPTSLTRGVSLDTGITMFRRNMSSIELLEWLRIRGLSEMDLSKLEGNFN